MTEQCTLKDSNTIVREIIELQKQFLDHKITREEMLARKAEIETAMILVNGKKPIQ